MRRLAAGCYTDDAGVIHLDGAEICLHFGVTPTEANQAQAIEMMRDVAQELLPNAKIKLETET